LQQPPSGNTFDLSKQQRHKTKYNNQNCKTLFMKKFLTTALLAVTLITSAFAFTPDPNKLNQKVIANFKQEYADATDVEWTVKPSFAKVTFTLNNQTNNAFYDLQGNFIGCSHAISLESLPTHAKRSFAKKYAEYTVKEAIQFDGTDETTYYISAENDSHAVILKVSEGMLSVYKKTNKN
jgi:hypothetical protein